MKLYNKVRTPCIGVCSTGIGDSVCRGCKRFDYEVIQWNGYSDQEKAAIDKRLSGLLARVVSAQLLIISESLLEQQLKLQQIRYFAYRDPYCWLYDLLKAGASQIKRCEDYGFQRLPWAANTSLSELRDAFEMEFYKLSVAHFERYIVANQQRAKTVSV